MTIPLIETNGMQTNFGPNWWACVSRLNERYGKHWLPVSNGTSAITLAVQATFARNYRVAVPDFTMVATLHAVVAAGCIPVIIPCDCETGLMNTEVLRQQWNWGQIQGAVIVSPFGAEFDHRKYEEIEMPLIYDLAGAWPMQLATAFPCTYSMHATKNISTREGGLIAFAFHKEWETARRLSCFDLDTERNSRTIYAGNDKLDEYRSGELLSQLENSQPLEARIAHKRDLVKRYAEALPIRPLTGLAEGYPTLCVFEVPDAARLERAGANAGITFKRYYYPLMSAMPFREHIPRVVRSREGLENYIAFPSDVNAQEFEQVVAVVKGVFGWG